MDAGGVKVLIPACCLGRGMGCSRACDWREKILFKRFGN